MRKDCLGTKLTNKITLIWKHGFESRKHCGAGAQPREYFILMSSFQIIEAVETAFLVIETNNQ